jgi:sulfur-carrier protein
MMKYKVKAFGITKEIVGSRDMIFEEDVQTVADLRKALEKKFPALSSLKSLFIAVNNEYAEENQSIRESDEIALIPPVSGG